MATASASVAVGSSVPKATLVEKPGETVDTSSFFAGKRVVLFAVPGAFTPGCSKSHLPGFVAKIDEYKGKGIDEVVCVSVNDPFVMQAWGEAHGAIGKVRMLSDPAAEFTKAMGLEVDLTAGLGSIRSKRYAALIENGVISKLNVEPDGTGMSCSLAPAFLKEL